MKKQLVTINLKKMNVLAIIAFIIPAMLGFVVQFFFFKDIMFNFRFWDIIILLFGYPILLCLHEAVHALVFIFSGAPKGSVRFGVIPKKFMLYCTTTKPLTVKSYKIALIMPIIITGIIPLIICIFFSNYIYVLLFSTLVSGGAGDIMMLNALAKYKNAKMVEDHPKAPAFYLLYQDEDLPLDFKEVTEEEEEALLKELDSK